MTPSAGRLPRYLSAAYALLIVYVCLHPFTDWRDGGLSPWAFVVQPWPKYVLWSDIWENIAGYMPLGFVLTASLRCKHKAGKALILTLCLCVALSFCIEFVQNYLPTRVASNLDLGTNTLGALLGAIAGLRWGKIFDESGTIERWRARHILHGHLGEVGLILIALWWLSQLEPTTTLFGNGDLRILFDLPAPMAFSAHRYMILETAIVASNTLGLGLLLMRAMREIDSRVFLVVLLIGLGLRSLADYVFMMPADPLHWATAGGLRGLAIGVVLVALARRLPRWSQHSLASLTLLCLTALVNMAPDNPFVDATVRTVQEGHFLNFYGLTQLSAALWPFLALTYLSALAGLRRW